MEPEGQRLFTPEPDTHVLHSDRDSGGSKYNKN